MDINGNNNKTAARVLAVGVLLTIGSWTGIAGALPTEERDENLTGFVDHFESAPCDDAHCRECGESARRTCGENGVASVECRTTYELCTCTFTCHPPRNARFGDVL